MNPSKSEIISISYDYLDDVALDLQQEPPGDKVTKIEDLDQLGAPLREAGRRMSLLAAKNTLAECQRGLAP